MVERWTKELSLAGLGLLGLAVYISSRKREKVIAAIETGGMSIKVAVAKNHPLNIVAESFFSTTTPAETLAAVAQWLKQWSVDYVGVASFGPVDLDPGSPTYGYITSTPKKEWRDTPLLKELGRLLNFSKPIGFNTDVNAAALAEFTYGEHPCSHSLVYITIGNGVGVGIIAGGQILRGLVHPEGGHVVVTRHPSDSAPSICPFHTFCAEGMATNIAIATRLGVDPSALKDVPDDNSVWELEAYYLAQVCLNVTLILSPEVIVIGGGVMNRAKLLPMIQAEFVTLLNDYVKHPKLQTKDYIRLPKLPNAGVVGAALLALSSSS